MLYGVRPQLQLDLVRRGYKVLVATPVRARVVPVPDAQARRAPGQPPLLFAKHAARVERTACAIERVTIQGYRGARDVLLEPGSLCALVGESSSGKSTVLSAIWTLLEAAAPMPTGEDVSRGEKRVHVEAVVGGRTLFLDAQPARDAQPEPRGCAATRSSSRPTCGRRPCSRRPTRRRSARSASSAASARSDGGLTLVRSLAALVEARVRGLVILIEEPELYLSPPAQRHLHRLLRTLASRGRNQVLYSTHSPVFLGVDRLDELVLVRHDERTGTTLLQPEALTREAGVPHGRGVRRRARRDVPLARGDARRGTHGEGRAARSSSRRSGSTPTRRRSRSSTARARATSRCSPRSATPAISPTSSCTTGTRRAAQQPAEAEQIANDAILRVAGRKRTIMLVPDFEGVSGLRARRGQAGGGVAAVPGAATARAGPAAAGGRARRRGGATRTADDTRRLNGG